MGCTRPSSAPPNRLKGERSKPEIGTRLLLEHHGFDLGDPAQRLCTGSPCGRRESASTSAGSAVSAAHVIDRIALNDVGDPVDQRGCAHGLVEEAVVS